ncbi:hypothetical protein EKB02_06990 [Streptococcus pseudopneumoniae]|nr:hypothetical protein [Streptococcus pseudopneumoniae]
MPFTILDILTLRVAKLCECGDFFELFPKWKQLLDKKKSSRIKYGYHHDMNLKSKPKLYGAKLLIAVL